MIQTLLLVSALLGADTVEPKKNTPPFAVTAFQRMPDDQTNEGALYRAKVVEFKRLTYPNVSGTFYELYLDGKLQEPRERRANGLIVVEIPYFGRLKCPKDLKEELCKQGYLEVRTFSRSRE